MVERKLAIEYRSLTTLRLDPKNPRLHSPVQIRQIAHSIETFGFNVPILINAQGQLIAGHGRLLAAQLLDLKLVPTITLEHLTETQIRAFLISDNKLSENADWDKQLLAEQFRALSELDLDFSVEITGFQMSEIDMMIEDLVPAHKGREDPADALPELHGKLKITHGGDLWILDRHRVVCDDALKESSYALLLQSQQAAMVFADPPYNVPIEGHVTGLGKIRHREFQMAAGEMTAEEFRNFLLQVFNNLSEYSSDDSLHYICMDWRHMGKLLAAGHHVYSKLMNVCIWTKDNAGMGSFYRSQH